MSGRPPFPPFTLETAIQKARMAEDAWNSRDQVRFAYEWQDDKGEWFRSYGNENWEFNEEGLMQRRFASINNLAIEERDRKFQWPPGSRPANHPDLSELGL